MLGLSEPASWKAVLQELQAVRCILLLGATDTGKTTFLIWLANALYAQGHRVAIVDADVGQSSLGPPTTIGLGAMTRPFQRVQEVPPLGLYFVGSTSPRAHLLPMIVGTKRLVDRAHTLGVDYVLVDTCGFITTDGGRALKHYQIDVVDPDIVVCFQRTNECEGLLLAYRRRRRPRVLRLGAATACRRRDAEERRLYRERSLQGYFARAAVITLPWNALNLIATPLWSGLPLDTETRVRLEGYGGPEVLWAERHEHEVVVVTVHPLASGEVAALERTVRRRVQTWTPEQLQGTVLGLLDQEGEVLGLGILQNIDFARQQVDVLAAGCAEAIAGIQWSRTRLQEIGQRHWDLLYTPEGRPYSRQESKATGAGQRRKDPHAQWQSGDR